MWSLRLVSFLTVPVFFLGLYVFLGDYATSQFSNGALSLHDSSKLRHKKLILHSLNYTNSVVISRKGSYSQREIKTTVYFLRENSDTCKNNGSALLLIIIVHSSFANFSAREAIRNTWGRFAVKNGGKLLFLIGISESRALQKKVAKENAAFGDIVQSSFIDSYYNLTLKTMAMINWACKHCSKAKYLLKVDDDVLVNMPRLLSYVKEKTLKRSIIGKVVKKAPLVRKKVSKYFIPPETFNASFYPDYSLGGSYLVSGDSVCSLAERALQLKPIYLEDVFLTGIVAGSIGIKRVGEEAMTVRIGYRSALSLRSEDYLTVHRYSPRAMVEKWHSDGLARKSLHNFQNPSEKLS